MRLKIGKYVEIESSIELSSKKRIFDLKTKNLKGKIALLSNGVEQVALQGERRIIKFFLPNWNFISQPLENLLKEEGRGESRELLKIAEDLKKQGFIIKLMRGEEEIMAFGDIRTPVIFKLMGLNNLRVSFKFIGSLMKKMK